MRATYPSKGGPPTLEFSFSANPFFTTSLLKRCLGSDEVAEVTTDIQWKDTAHKLTVKVRAGRMGSRGAGRFSSPVRSPHSRSRTAHIAGQAFVRGLRPVSWCSARWGGVVPLWHCAGLAAHTSQHAWPSDFIWCRALPRKTKCTPQPPCCRR